MYLNWLPLYFVNEYNLQLSRSALFSSAVFFAGVGGDYLGGVISDRILREDGTTSARRGATSSSSRSSCSFLFMLPVFLTHNLTADRDQPGGGVLLRRADDRPDVVDSDGHRAEILRDGERSDEHRIGRRRRPLTDRRSATSSTGPATGSCRSSDRWACCCSAPCWRSRCIPNGVRRRAPASRRNASDHGRSHRGAEHRALLLRERASVLSVPRGQITCVRNRTGR